MAARRVTIRILAVLATVAVLVGLLALASVVLRPELESWARRQVIPALEQSTGRKVDLGSVGVSLFPRLRVRLHDLRIAGTGDRPLFTTPDLSIGLRLWPTIRSRGKDVQVTRVDIDSPELNLVRLRDGTVDAEQVLRHMQQGPQTRTVSVDRLVIHDGTVREIDSAAPGSSAATASRLDLDVSGLTTGRPVSVALKAAIGSDRQDVFADLHLDRLPTGGQPPRGSGKVELASVPVSALGPLLPQGLETVVQGGSLDAKLALSVTPDDAYALSGTARASGLSLRGQPASASFTMSARAPAAAPTQATVDLTSIALKGPGVDLGGSAQIALAGPRIAFDLAGPLLDLDALLAALPPRGGKGGAPSAARSSVQAAGSLALGRLVAHSLVADDVRLRASAGGGALRIEQGTARFYGGTADLGGTTIDLSPPTPTWNLQARLAGVDLAQAMRSVTGQAPVGGNLGSSVALRGQGLDWQAISRAITGSAALSLDNGSLAGIDVGAALAQAVRQQIGPAFATRVPPATITRLDHLAGRFVIDHGFMTLNAPLTFSSQFGSGSLEGRIGLDHALELRGTLALDGAFVSMLSSGAVARPLSVPVAIGGTLESPRITSVDLGALASQLVPRSDIERRAGQLFPGLSDQARKQAQQQLQNLGR